MGLPRDYKNPKAAPFISLFLRQNSPVAANLKINPKIIILVLTNDRLSDIILMLFGQEPLAQAAEHLPFKQGVPGSIPGWLTIGPLVKRLRHRPFTAESWVRFPYGSPASNVVNGLTKPFTGFLFFGKMPDGSYLGLIVTCGYP